MQKKAYIKPCLLYEDFVLDTSIATCAFKGQMQSTDTSSCGVSLSLIDDGITLFASTPSPCSMDVHSEAYENFCYENGADGNNILAS